MMDLTFLGTSCMVPTKERNAPSIYVEIQGKGLLFDCGEGTQRQMNCAGISRAKIKYIFISHWHADHTAGLLGLIQTIGFSSEIPEIELFGPTGTEELFNHLMRSSIFENKVNIKVHEVNCPKVKTIFETSDFIVKAVNLYHGIPSLGFRVLEKDRLKVNMAKLKKENVPEGPHIGDLQKGNDSSYAGKKLRVKEYTSLKKGKSFTIIADTGFTQHAIDLAKDSDVLICESTYNKDHEGQAKDYHHLTSEQAAQIASMSDSQKLYLNHFSQRYKSLHKLLEEAKTVFPETEISHDYLKIKI